MTEDDKRFLISFEKGEPQWDGYEFEYFKDYPSVKWKLINLAKLAKQIWSKYDRRKRLYCNKIIFFLSIMTLVQKHCSSYQDWKQNKQTHWFSAELPIVSGFVVPKMNPKSHVEKDLITSTSGNGYRVTPPSTRQWCGSRRRSSCRCAGRGEGR